MKTQQWKTIVWKFLLVFVHVTGKHYLTLVVNVFCLCAAIPPVIMDALEKRAFLKVRTLCVLIDWIFVGVPTFRKAETVVSHSPCWTSIELQKSEDTCHLVGCSSDLCVIFPAVPNPERSHPSGARWPVVCYSKKIFIQKSVLLLPVSKTSLFSFSSKQPGLCNASLLRPLPAKKVPSLTWVCMTLLFHFTSNDLFITTFHYFRFLFFFLCSSMSVSGLEKELQERIRESSPQTTTVYFNKGL